MLKVGVVSAVVVTILGVGGYLSSEWYKRKDVLLSARPIQQEINETIPSAPSTIGIRARTDYGTLQSVLSNLTSEPFNDSGADTWQHQTWGKTKGIPKCRTRGFKIYCEDTWIKTKGPKLSIGYRWDVTVQRSGSLSVGQNGQNVRVAVPVKFKGNAGLRGDGAKILKLNKKNFDGSLTVFLDVAFDLTSDWCPSVSVEATHRWHSKARVEIIDGIFVSVSGKADEMIAKMKEDAHRLIKEALSCEDIQKIVSPHWASYSIPIQGIESIKSYVNVVPESVAFSGMRAEEEGVGIAIQLTSLVSLASSPVERKQLQLPALERVDWRPGLIHLAVPVSASIHEIETLAANELVGKEFSHETPVGLVSVEIRDVEMYQSGTKLVVALEFAADVPGEIFSVSGEIFLSAKPNIDPDTDEIYLSDVEFSRSLDNDLWNVLSAVFETQVRAAIVSGLRYDLTDDIDRIKTATYEKLSQPDFVPGLILEIQRPEVALDGPVISDGTMTVFLQTKTKADAFINTDFLTGLQ